MDVRTVGICDAVALSRRDMGGIASMDGRIRPVVKAQNHTVVDAGIIVGRHGRDLGRVEAGRFGRLQMCIQE